MPSGAPLLPLSLRSFTPLHCTPLTLRTSRLSKRIIYSSLLCSVLVTYIFVLTQQEEFNAYLSQSIVPWQLRSKFGSSPSSSKSPVFAADSSAPWDGHEDSVGTSGKSGSMSQPKTGLGFEADEAFKLGTITPLTYRYTLSSFIRRSFPEYLQTPLLSSLDVYFPLTRDGEPGPTSSLVPAMTDSKTIWQTDKDHTVDVGSWTFFNQDWKWKQVNDTEAEGWMRKTFAESKVEKLWDDLPTMILKADLLRYLLLLIEGGVYSDMDTFALKPVSDWGANATVWNPDDFTPSRPSIIVGIEVDLRGEDDTSKWIKYWTRPLQILQWTFASAPHHPILLDVVARIISATARATEWVEARDKLVEELRKVEKFSEADKLARVPVFEAGDRTGFMDVLEWTGPGVFTDAVFRYLGARYNFTWPSLQGIDKPMQIGDVVVLPVTGFSPGRPHSGSKSMWDDGAMVWHQFMGTWKKAPETNSSE